MSDWINVAPVDEFPPGDSRLVDADDTMIAVFNLDGEYYAIEDKCTHDGSPFLGCGLELEDLVEGDEIICPRHGARFCIRTGEALTAPAYEPTDTFPVRDQDGMVQVRDDRWD
ncbi:MAG: non-heme iron oxygenase ferredoxin subunit [Gammaproteobacteria bacterium]